MHNCVNNFLFPNYLIGDKFPIPHFMRSPINDAVEIAAGGKIFACLAAWEQFISLQFSAIYIKHLKATGIYTGHRKQNYTVAGIENRKLFSYIYL